MSRFDEIAAHLGSGKTLYTRARGVRFRAHVAGGFLVVDSERSGVSRFTPAQVSAAATAISASAPALDDRAVQVARSWVGAVQDSMAGTPNVAKRAAPGRSAAPARSKASSRSPASKTTTKSKTARKTTRTTGSAA